ncbi:MAG TPA: DUF1697 domain-containing protein [Gaiellaceae bacterium]|nr:DUF1697 domain-containing protein [Gaiellaceae bacterium]
MPRQLALLRGVNVGRNKRVEMTRLRALLEELGYRDVRTYVNSGNAIFSGPSRSEAHLEAAIAKAFGFEVPVVLRSRDELADIVQANPLRDIATDPAKYLVLFCAAKASTGLDPGDFAPETFHVRGREMYLWAPGGIGTSPLAKALAAESVVDKSTARNWRTVEKLLALADDA